MTTYYRATDGSILSSHEISKAYNATDKAVPFREFSRDWLVAHDAKRDPKITVDDLILAGQIREAVFRFKEVTGCSYDRAKNAVYTMKAAFGC